MIKYVLQFNFKVSNNKVKYKALIVKLHLAKELGVQGIKVFTNLQLVVG